MEKSKDDSDFHTSHRKDKSAKLKISYRAIRCTWPTIFALATQFLPKTLGEFGWVTSNLVPHLHSNQCHSIGPSPHCLPIPHSLNYGIVSPVSFRLCTHLSGCVSHAGLDADHVRILSQTFMGSTACGSQHQHYCCSCKILYLLQ